jgi:hypothetical protein
MAYFRTRSGGTATPPCAFASERAYPVVSSKARKGKSAVLPANTA